MGARLFTGCGCNAIGCWMALVGAGGTLDDMALKLNESNGLPDADALA